MAVLSVFGVVNTAQMESAALEVMRSGRIASGPHVAQFEQGLSSLLNQQHVVATSDMTSAINLALYMIGVGEGDEVLTSSFSCMSTNSPIALLKATPVWVDFAPGSVSMDPTAFERSITPRTKAAILYHVAGYPGPAKKIADICRQHNITLIEDCNNALLATLHGVTVGSFGDYAVYSFYPNRQINTFEGGALVCPDPESAERARRLRRFGVNYSTFRTSSGEINPDSDVPEVGWACSLSNLSAAVGMAQFDSLESRVEQTRRNALRLSEGLGAVCELSVIQPLQGSDPVYWGFLIQTKHKLRLILALKERGIQASGLHQSNDRYTCFTASVNPPEDLKNTVLLQQSVLAIPCGWWLSDGDITSIIECVKSATSQVTSIADGSE
ncbi:DegT/DnrJ/EryC1/StrS family aminotransferase [Allopusillimonas ginsengisoli]|uniref:DegT/DnrJ/EryC1/StrS family aminotransferase n=1 Tax=Allopusillimonas ginsengisoli TaxID=453575 RepID=UPI0039C3293C